MYLKLGKVFFRTLGIFSSKPKMQYSISRNKDNQIKIKINIHNKYISRYFNLIEPRDSISVELIIEKLTYFLFVCKSSCMCS